MKHRYIYIFALITLFVMSGCNDWLDVSPRQEMRDKDLFSNEEGFKGVLTGAYMQLGEASLYGRNTSMYIPEYMARHWTLSEDETSISYGFGNLIFTSSNVESILSTVWREYYNVIVQLNNLLGAFDENEVSFEFNKDKLIKGEALALRAFLHFELLRYFGPAPLDAVDGESTIPYVTAMTRDVSQLLSLPWSQVVALIEKDFNEAETLLFEADPMVAEVEIDDDWATMYRENRFNYYAVLGAKARFYQWIGNKEKATEYARMVVDAEDKDGNLRFKLANMSELTSANPTNLIMYSEMLFGVYYKNHQAIIQSLFKGKDALLVQNKDQLDSFYQVGLYGDIRYGGNPPNYWESVTHDGNVTRYHFLKYTGTETIDPVNVIPIIRLAELYLILMENEPLDVANELLVTFCNARNIYSSSVDTEFVDDAAVKARLEIEYRKDFYGEGQMFFFYKRLKYDKFEWPTNIPALEVPENGYVLPLPKEQIAFE